MKKLFGISLLSACLVIGLAFTEKDKEAKNFTPPGTIHLEEANLFVDKNEVTNADWAEYLIALKNEGFEEEYQNAKPDSASWFSVYTGRQDAFQGEYAHYPVVGLSPKQIMDYCSWRSARVNAIHSNFKVRYRLPTVEDWEMLTKIVKKEKIKEGLYAYSQKNSKKIKGVYDNVEEVIHGDDFVTAGFNKTEDQNLIYREEMPSAFVGFRCVAEVAPL